MDAFRVAYLIFGSAICITGAMMILTYTRSFPWWKDPVGRMMIVYAGAEVIMSALLTITVVTQTGPHWFRLVWFILQVVLSGCFVYQTLTIKKLRRDQEAQRTEEERR